MADSTKHLAIKGSTLLSDLKSLFSLKNKNTLSFAYGFMFAFILFTAFLAFNPSQNSTSPWFSTTTTNTFSFNGSQNSHFPSIFSHFFPNSSNPLFNLTSFNTTTQNQQSHDKVETFNTTRSQHPQNQTQNGKLHDKVEAFNTNQTQNEKLHDKGETFINTTRSQNPQNKTQNGQLHDKGETFKPKSSSNTTGVKKKESNGTIGGNMKKGSEDLVKGLMGCDFFDGEWVRDDSYPLYKPGSCSLIDEQFNCFVNGRPDKDYQKFKWKPKGCTIPRLNGSHMLELLRGKRLVFVGDSLNRNMWESLICILRNSVKDQSKVYEASGRHHFRGEASYSFVFKDYNCTIELFVSPFLVREWEISEKNGAKKETLRLDLIGTSAERYKSADIIIFNTGHWWTHDKTSKGKDYYQEGSHVYGELNVLEAFRKALTTWARWVDANVNSQKSLVFFRGYSASHFSGGQWNSGGACDHETEPIKNATYLRQYPPKMLVLERVLKAMKTHVSYLNITTLTDYRKDGHPSMYRKQHLSEGERKSPLLFQDCSHWCLPGVPDAWNELLYAELVLKEYQHQQKRP